MPWAQAHLPNCTAKSRAEKKCHPPPVPGLPAGGCAFFLTRPVETGRFFVADGLDTAVDLGALFLRRPHERGYVTDWGAELDVWQRMCHADVLGVRPAETSLVVTEPLFSCNELKDSLAEFVFEEMGFAELVAPPAPLLAYQDLRAWDPESVMARTGCGVVVDSGFSFTHIVPLYEGKIVYKACKRIDVGGKVLTNLLKETLSTRQWNVMEETVLVNAIKERAAFISQDLREDLLACRRRGRLNPIRRRYALPTGLPGEDRLGTLIEDPGAGAAAGGVGATPAAHPPDEAGAAAAGAGSPQKKARVEVPVSPAKARHEDEAILVLNNERFTVPEALFAPALLGLDQAGVPDAIAAALGQLDPALHPLLYATVLPVGGNAQLPGFRERLARDLRSLAPADFEVSVPAAPQPSADAVWRGGVRAAAAGAFDHAWVSKAEYEEKGALHVRSRLKEAEAVFRVKKIK
jgi:actin-related protein 6